MPRGRPKLSGGRQSRRRDELATASIQPRPSLGYPCELEQSSTAPTMGSLSDMFLLNQIMTESFDPLATDYLFPQDPQQVGSDMWAQILHDTPQIDEPSQASHKRRRVMQAGGLKNVNGDPWNEHTFVDDGRVGMAAPSSSAGPLLGQAQASLDSPRDKHEVFTEWSRQRGVETSGVEAAAFLGRGIGIRAKQQIEQGTCIIQVPKKAMFRPSITSRLAREVASGRLGSIGHLAKELMDECKKPDSSLQIWKATWPTRTELEASHPQLWSQELQELLPKSAYEHLMNKFKYDYELDLAYFKNNLGSDFDEHEYEYYWLLVNTRSMCYKPQGSKPGYAVLCPFMDYLNHGAKGEAANVAFNTWTGTYAVIADKDYAPGDEICSHYTSNTMDYMMAQYGFVSSRPSIDDSVSITSAIQPNLEKFREALKELNILGPWYLVPLSTSSDNCFPMSATNSSAVQWIPCYRTQCAVRRTFMSPKQLDRYKIDEDDSLADREQSKPNYSKWKVRKFLEPLLRAYRHECVRMLAKCEALSDEECGIAKDMLCTRWTTIRCALDSYLMGEW